MRNCQGTRENCKNTGLRGRMTVSRFLSCLNDELITFELNYACNFVKLNLCSSEPRWRI